MGRIGIGLTTFGLNCFAREEMNYDNCNKTAEETF